MCSLRHTCRARRQSSYSLQRSGPATPREFTRSEAVGVLTFPLPLRPTARVGTPHVVIAMGKDRLELLQGTLDLMVLQTLASMGRLNGYAIARRIEQVSGEQVLLNQGTIYASLVRLQQRGWISAEWGTSSTNRKAKFYTITARGRKQLARDADYWRRLADLMGRMLADQSEGVE